MRDRIILTEIYTTGALWWKKSNEGDLLLDIRSIGPVECNGKSGSYLSSGANKYEVAESPKRIHLMMAQIKP
jgi:hypothetical protein